MIGKKSIFINMVIFFLLIQLLSPIIISGITVNSNADILEEENNLKNHYDFYCYSQHSNEKYSREENSPAICKSEGVISKNAMSEISYESLSDSPWPMKCHDLHHTSRSPYTTVNVTGLEKWRFKTDYGIDGSPIIDENGIIYFGAKDGFIYALNSNGTEKWKYQTDMWITSTPALAENGTLYIGSWDCKFYAFNSSTGERIWRISLGGIIGSSPAIAEDGTIYTANVKGRVYAINPNGTKKWYYDTKGSDIWGDIAIGDDGTVYIGTWNNDFFAINPNGTLKWKFGTGAHIKGPASIADDGTVYIGSWDDYLYALYPNNGTMKWKCKVGHGTETNPSIAEDGTIYVGGDYLWAINPNGTKKWTFDLGNGRHIHQSSPAISADGTIYVGTNINSVDGGDIIAVNPNGTERWRKKICTWWCDSSPCIGKDGTVYIGSQDYGGYIHAFGPVESNNPPEIPTITGKTNGETGSEYQYWFRSIDPDNNPIKYYIDWGDGSEGWERECASGEECVYRHTWSEDGNYTIRCKVKDVMGEESDWAYLEVTMPHSYNNPFWWLNGLLDGFPLLQSLLLFIMD